MSNNIDVHSALTLHRFRSAELYADAERQRVARAVRHPAGQDRPRWWARLARRHGGAGSRAPAMPPA